MVRRTLFALILLVTLTPLVSAVITAPVKLSAFMSESDYILVAKIESLDAAKGQIVFSVKEDLKGKFDLRRINVVIRPDQDAVKDNHVPQLLKRLAPELPLVLFISSEDKSLKSYAFTNGTWIQLLGNRVDKDRVVWSLTHGEPFLRKMYKGTTAEFVTLLKDVIAGKAKAPELDKNVEPGFGPELPAKSTRRTPSLDDANGSSALFAVIPTLGLAGPLAILAILFPTVFGGVLILFRQWTAFIAMFSINSMLYMFYWWNAAKWEGSWWGSDVGIWCVMTAVAIACCLWGWRRQLHNLSQGADALETPSRTEFVVLSVLALTCVAFIAGTRHFAPPPATDILWNLTLVLAAGILVGLAYKVFRAVFDVMLPMATEGVMLGACSLASLGVLTVLVRAEAATPTESSSKTSASGDLTGPQFVGQKWAYTTKRGGLFVSSPLIAGHDVYAAAAHPTFKYGALYKIELVTGTEQWKFNDDGAYKQPISSPFLAGGNVYIGEGFHEDPNCKLYCVRADNGVKRWEFPTTSQTEATPAVVDGRLYAGCGNDGFLCLEAGGESPAKVVWRFPDQSARTGLLRFGAGAHIEGSRVYVGTGVDRLQKSDKGETAVFCLDATTGRQIWKTPMPLPVWSTPVLAEGDLFVTVGNGDVFDDAPEPAGAVFRLNPQDGAIVWKLDLPNGVMQKPAVDERRVFAGCRDGFCYAIDRAKGTILWKVGLGSPIIGAPVLARSSRAEGTVSVFVISQNGRVACLSPNTGLAAWTTRLDAKLVYLAGPAISVRPTDDGEERLLVVGGGDAVSGAKATLICLEDRVPQ
jgi:outer membrane protein assembly factor BamB